MKSFQRSEPSATLPAHETPQIPQGEPVPAWLARAETLKPALRESIDLPRWLVRPVADATLHLRFRMEREADAAALAERTLRAGDSVIVDFEGHRTGYLSFTLRAHGREPDAPARLRLSFGEVPPDVAEPLHPYTGWLSEAWLPEEVLTIDDLPQRVRVPRRHAFRYVRIDVIASSKEFGLRFHDLQAHAVTSAHGQVPALPHGAPDWAARVDEVAVATLRDCMQTCFEDGPRRDRRLWIGDLRLQALVHYATYGAGGAAGLQDGRLDIVRRCLLLFAGLPRADGLVNACVYERPVPTYANICTLDYAALYAVVLAEYVEHSGDEDLGRELWPVARRQLEILLQHVDTQGLFRDPGDAWIFIDWCEGLDRSAAMHGVLLFALRQAQTLAIRLGVADEVAHWPALTEQMKRAAHDAWWDAGLGLYVSGAQRQVSVASQAWLVLAGVPPSHEAAVQALQAVERHPQALTPVTPYLQHYLVEAWTRCGCPEPALRLIRHYWGSMVDAGADTFWEAHVPGSPLASPYGDVHANSYCHAWSCTPAWFFRRQGAHLAQHGALHAR